MGQHILFQTGIRRLGSKEAGFFYRYPGTNETVRQDQVLTRIENLRVPPAWEDTRIAQSPSAKVQAIGYDSAGRLQYLYHPKYRERKEREKFERILRFSDALPEMRRVTSNHLRHKYLDREKVLAAMTRLMNAAYFRVGEERYAKKNRTYGIATLRRKHLRMEGDTMIAAVATGVSRSVPDSPALWGRVWRLASHGRAVPGRPDTSHRGQQLPTRPVDGPDGA
jgi:DNA topoisomerase I